VVDERRNELSTAEQIEVHVDARGHLLDQPPTPCLGMIDPTDDIELPPAEPVGNERRREAIVHGDDHRLFVPG
jgi:hypothetical protein